MDTATIDTKPHLSVSQINMYLRCPRQWEYRYVKGLRIPPSGAMVQSKAWHEVVEKNYRQKIDTATDLPLIDMTDMYAETFDRAFSAEEIILEKSAGDLKDEGISITTTHHIIIAPMVKPLLVEEKFNLDLGDEFPYTFVGIWDLVEEDGMIADNKAYSKTPNQADIDNDLQLTAYAMAYRLTRGVVEKGLRIDAIVKNKTPKVAQVKTTRTTQDCRWFISLVENVVSAISAANFFPNPTGWHCSPRFCGYWDRCKGGSHGKN